MFRFANRIENCNNTKITGDTQPPKVNPPHNCCLPDVVDHSAKICPLEN